MKSVLILIPYQHLYPPINGGMQRSFNLFHQLTLHFKVTLISFQPAEEVQRASSVFPSLNSADILDTKKKEQNGIFLFFTNRVQNAIIFKWYKKSLTVATDGLFTEYYPVLKSVLSKKKFDFVLLEDLSTVNAVKVIKKLSPESKIIYDAHNVNTNLALEIGNKYYEMIKRTESALYKNVNSIVACSVKDLADIVKLNGGRLNGTVIPNGVSVASQNIAVNRKNHTVRNILFCGSLDYKPNCDGLIWFLDEVWPNIKSYIGSVSLFIIGSGDCPQLFNRIKNDNSIVLIGKVSDVKPYYFQSDVAIAPILSGSGTRLKVLEAMGLGIPMISTKKGAEGIEYTDEVHILIRDKAELFAKGVIDLLTNDRKRLYLSSQALKLAKEKYDWNIVGAKLASYLNNM